MQTFVKGWLQNLLDSSAALKEKGPLRFALRFSLYNTVIANIFNVIIHLGLSWADLLGYPLARGLPNAVMATTTITFVISMSVGFCIVNAVLALSIQRDEFERLSLQDALSGVMNRRAFFQYFERTERAGLLILIDIDHFKAINDDFGHPAGDEVIRRVGQALKAMCGGTGAAVGRVGGEEFAMFIPHSDGRCDRDHAEAIRRAVADMRVDGIDRPTTISLGVAASIPRRSAIETYAAADRVLYLAKSAGRNRVVHEADMRDMTVRRILVTANTPRPEIGEEAAILKFAS